MLNLFNMLKNESGGDTAPHVKFLFAILFF